MTDGIVEVADAQRRRHAHVDLAQRVLDDVVAAAAQHAPRNARCLGAHRPTVHVGAPHDLLVRGAAFSCWWSIELAERGT